jgi:hypothetical protein
VENWLQIISSSNDMEKKLQFPKTAWKYFTLYLIVACDSWLQKSEQSTHSWPAASKHSTSHQLLYQKGHKKTGN